MFMSVANKSKRSSSRMDSHIIHSWDTWNFSWTNIEGGLRLTLIAVKNKHDFYCSFSTPGDTYPVTTPHLGKAIESACTEQGGYSPVTII